MYYFNLFALPNFILSAWILFISILVLLKKSKTLVYLAYFCTIAWFFGCGMAFLSVDYLTALPWIKFLFSGIILICPSLYHFILQFLGLLKLRKEQIRLLISYLVSFVFLYFTIFTNLLVYPQKCWWGYYPHAVLPLHPIFLVWFGIVYFHSVRLLFVSLYKAEYSSRQKLQIRYFLITYIVTILGGIDFIPDYGFSFYPFGLFLTTIGISITAYGIARHRLLDINVALTRASIFIFVYTLVLGIPFFVGLKMLGFGIWLFPIALMGVFATVGPFIYFYFQRQAEDRLLQEQRRYQATLRQASAGMGKIKDLKKLLNMIVYVLTHAIQIEHALVYIYNENQKKYVLGALKRKAGQSDFVDSIEMNSLIVDYFLENRNPIIYEEIKQKALDYKDPKLIHIKEIILTLMGALVVPIFIDQNLTAIIVMGKKESGSLYSEDDLSVFSILANQTALAIENAIFYEQMKLTHEQLFQAEKMATIGTMADGLSHQINNRFHALGFIAGDAIDTIQMNQKELSQDKMKEVLKELERAFIRVQENVVQGGEIVQGLLRYTRKGDAGFTAVDVDAVLKSALEMVQFKIKMHELKIVREYDVTTMPKVKGNFTQLQEVFFNLIDNGYDAMMQRKKEKQEPGFQPTLIVRVFKQDNLVQIIFEDNGMGVKDEDTHKLFTPFFTTKLSSKKGTGLGLYVIKKIVEDNHQGQVEMVSKYMQGTQMKLRLPIAIG